MEVRGSVWSPTSICSAYLCSLLEGLEVFSSQSRHLQLSSRADLCQTLS